MPALFDISMTNRGESFVYRLDVRTKMGISLLASLAVILMNHPVPLTVLTLFSGLYAVNLRRVKILLIVYAAVALMWCMAVAMMAGLHMLWSQTSPIAWDKLLVPFLRTTVMVNVALALALSSGIQSAVAAFKALRLPFCIYVPLTVMIRFIPTFIEDVRQIRECLQTRGFRLTLFGFFLHPVLAVRLLLMPLLFRSLRSSDELGIAAELKGLRNGQRITPLRRASFGREDVLVFGLTMAALALSAVLQVLLKSGSGGVF
jgi:energy-coupling factor transport system permease protein